MGGSVVLSQLAVAVRGDSRQKLPQPFLFIINLTPNIIKLTLSFYQLDPKYYQVDIFLLSTWPRKSFITNSNQNLCGPPLPVKMKNERKRIKYEYLCIQIGDCLLMIVKIWAGEEAAILFGTEVKFWSNSTMGEEKPSVPWVLEDYETSQVGMIPSEQKLKSVLKKVRIKNKQTNCLFCKATTHLTNYIP